MEKLPFTEDNLETISPRGSEVYSHVEAYNKSLNVGISRKHLEAAILNLAAKGEGHPDFQGPYGIKEFWYTMAFLEQNGYIGTGPGGYVAEE